VARGIVTLVPVAVSVAVLSGRHAQSSGHGAHRLDRQDKGQNECDDEAGDAEHARQF
jgi:hypothetical protein